MREGPGARGSVQGHTAGLSQRWDQTPVSSFSLNLIPLRRVPPTWSGPSTTESLLARPALQPPSAMPRGEEASVPWRLQP